MERSPGSVETWGNTASTSCRASFLDTVASNPCVKDRYKLLGQSMSWEDITCVAGNHPVRRKGHLLQVKEVPGSGRTEGKDRLHG